MTSRHHLAQLTRAATLAVVMSLFMVASPATAATNTVQLYISPPTVSTTVGKNVSYQIRLSKNSTSRVDYVNAIVTYPAQHLEVVAISQSASYFTDNNGPMATYNNPAGSLHVSGSGATLPTQADVLVATITFHAKAAGTAPVLFSGSSQAGNLLRSGAIKNYLTGTTHGTLNITQAIAAPTKRATPPSPIPTPTPSDEPAPIVGADTPPGVIEPPTSDVVISTDKSQSSGVTATDSQISTWTVVSMWSAFAIGFMLISAGLALFMTRRRIHFHLRPSPHTSLLNPPAASTSDSPADVAEAVAVLSHKRPALAAEHPAIHAVETTQSHPVQPGAKRKLRSKLFSPSIPYDKPLPAVNTVHKRQNANRATKQIQPISPSVESPESTQQTGNTATPPEQAATPAAANKPHVTVPTPEQLASLPDDIFEAGEQRLKLEGLSEAPPKPTQPTRA